LSDPSAADLIEENSALAQRLARRYSRGFGQDEDMVQVAMMGLFMATQRYDAQTGPFRPFAVATISGELKKHLRNHGWSVRVPRRLQEQTIVVDRAISELHQSLGHSPTPHEVAAATGLSVDEVLAGLRASEARFGRELPPSDRIPQEGTTTVDLTDKLVVAAAVDHLDEADENLLRMRYVDELTQRDIGSKLDISQTQVHRRLTVLHDRLREFFDSTGYEP